jgi:hypothetical protein
MSSLSSVGKLLSRRLTRKWPQELRVLLRISSNLGPCQDEEIRDYFSFYFTSSNMFKIACSVAHCELRSKHGQKEVP